MSAEIPQMSENALDHIPTCTDAQRADARRYVERMAPEDAALLCAALGLVS